MENKKLKIKLSDGRELIAADPNNEDYADFFNIGKYESEE